MKSTSSGSGLRSVLAIASTPRSATSRRRISASISFLSCSMRSSYSSCSSRSSSGVSSPLDLRRCGLLHQLARAGRRGRGSAACGTGSTCRRPGGPAPCPAKRCTACGRERAHHRSWSIVHQRLRAASAASSSGVSASPSRRRAPCPGPASARCISRLVVVGVVVARRRRSPYSGPRSEKYTSNTVSNARQWRVVLHQRGAERVLERLAVLERDVLDRLHRVEVLGHATPAARRRAARGRTRASSVEHRPPTAGGSIGRRRHRSCGARAEPALDAVLVVGELLDAPWRCRSGT